MCTAVKTQLVVEGGEFFLDVLRTGAVLPSTEVQQDVNLHRREGGRWLDGRGGGRRELGRWMGMERGREGKEMDGKERDLQLDRDKETKRE